MIKISSAIFKTFFLSLCIVANTHFAFAQTASILPPGYTQYLDSNGKPLSAGKVYNYIPNTTTPKTTWQDAAETTPNTNPVILDAGGRAKILGDGSYRQIVKDRNNVTIWDAVTSSTGSGSSAPTATGDGDLVGTIKPWAGMTAPNQYAFTYGQEVSRTTYATLYTAITSSQSVFCNSGSPTLNGLSDTTNFWIGMSVEVSCVAAGFSTIVSKTSSTVTLAANANVTTNTTAVFYPWGRGNGITTFNLPDLRGVVPAGNNNMGGVASANLTTTYFGSTNPNSVGALGGSQSTTLVDGNSPSRNSAGTITVVGTGQAGNNSYIPSVTSGTSMITAFNGSVASTVSAGAGINLYATTQMLGAASATWSYTGITQGGGIAASATVAAAGSGYTPGSQTITVSGGTCTTQPQFTVTVSGGGAFSGTPSLLTAGECTVAPTNPAATTGGGGTGGTLIVVYTGKPFSLVQPTKTTNYIIKITPDTNSASASGVTSLGGMTGDIACGSGLLCTGNIVSVSASSLPLTVGATTINSGIANRVLYDNAGTLGEYAISGTGNVAMTTSPTFVTPVLGVASATSLTTSGVISPGNQSNWYLTNSGVNGVINWDTNDYYTYNKATDDNQWYIGGSLIQSLNATGLALTGTATITSASASALAVGRVGAINPAFQVDASAVTQAAGIKITSAASGSAVGISVTDSGTNNSLTINAKGNGNITLGNSSTGNIVLNRALNYGGITLNNSVTGTGSMVLSTNPALTTPNLGIPSAVTLTNGTGLPISTGVSGLGTNVASFLATPSSANLASALTDETGSGAVVFGTAPTISGLFDISGAIKYSTQFAPAQITSDQNNYNPSSVNCSTSTTLLINSDAARNITGFAGGATGCEMRLINNGSFTITLKEESGLSTAANRFKTGGDIALASNVTVTLLYDGTASRWRMASPASTGGGGGTVTSVATSNGIAGGTITTSGTIVNIVPTFGTRLTLTSGTPVLTSSVTAATTVYLTGYTSQYVTTYDGTNLLATDIGSELSVALGSNWSANSNYDFFVGYDSGALRLCTGPAWSSDTSRGTGAGTTELERVRGMWMNKVSITCRYNNTTTFTLAAQRGSYLGTMRTGSAGQTNYIFGARGAPPTAALFGLWNNYNRVDIATQVQDTTSSWTYNSTTWRAPNGNTNTFRASFVIGIQEDAIYASYSAHGQNSASGYCALAIGYDSTSTALNTAQASNQIASATMFTGKAEYQQTDIGFHYVSALEQMTGGTGTFFGANLYLQSIFTFRFKM